MVPSWQVLEHIPEAKEAELCWPSVSCCLPSFSQHWWLSLQAFVSLSVPLFGCEHCCCVRSFVSLVLPASKLWWVCPHLFSFVFDISLPLVPSYLPFGPLFLFVSCVLVRSLVLIHLSPQLSACLSSRCCLAQGGDFGSDRVLIACHLCTSCHLPLIVFVMRMTIMLSCSGSTLV